MSQHKKIAGISFPHFRTTSENAKLYSNQYQNTEEEVKWASGYGLSKYLKSKISIKLSC